MEEVVYRALGATSAKVLVGPGRGLDNGVISVGSGRVLIFTLDPVSAMPGLGPKLSAWLSVHLIASDYTTSGRSPEFAVFSYNFPREMSGSDRKEYLGEVGTECAKLGISIVGGHTGSYPGSGFTVIGTGMMLGTAPEGGYVTPAMAREGDTILVTKHAGIEATASLALSFSKFVEKVAGPKIARRGRKMVEECSTVEDAYAARGAGLGARGVTSMHDATEGGVLGALEEMAAASRKRFVVDAEAIPVTEETRSICGLFDIDPLASMGEGALLLTCRPERVPTLRGKMAAASIPIDEIGRVEAGGSLFVKRNGKRTKWRAPERDAYWTAYERAARRNLS
jgi:hydrogenase maturation factor